MNPLGVARTFEVEVIAYSHDEERDVVQTLRDPHTGAYPRLSSPTPAGVEIDGTFIPVRPDGRVWRALRPNSAGATFVLDQLRTQRGERSWSAVGFAGYTEPWVDDPEAAAVFERDPYFPCATFADRHAAVWLARVPAEVQFERFSEYLYAQVDGPNRRTDPDGGPLSLPDDLRATVRATHVRAVYHGLLVTFSGEDTFTATFRVSNYTEYVSFARFVAGCTRERVLDQIPEAIDMALAVLRDRLEFALRGLDCTVTVRRDAIRDADFARAVVTRQGRITDFGGLALRPTDEAVDQLVWEVRRRFGLT